MGGAGQKKVEEGLEMGVMGRNDSKMWNRWQIMVLVGEDIHGRQGSSLHNTRRHEYHW
jgi:hypothetical protein